MCRQHGKHRDGPANILARDEPDKYGDEDSEDQDDTRKRNLFMRYGRVFR